MNEKTVVRETDGPVAWLRLNRPASMNALNDALLTELGDELDAVQHDDHVRVVVITGSGRAFCAGADLKAIAPTGQPEPASILAFVRRAAAAIERIPRLDKPVIAAVNGVAAAGGLELAMACDLVLAADSARIGDAHANYGLLPGAGGAARLARIAGPMIAKRLAFTGALVPPAELVACGLVTEVVAADQLEKRATELAQTIAAKSPTGLAWMKRLIDDSVEQSLPTALRAEHLALYSHAHSADMREGLTAFQEKRAPRYAGR